MVLEKLRGKRNTRFIFFGGKGGVGKTSLSASTAVHLSKKGKKVLVVSTDPAHSLSDSLEMEIGADLVRLDKNLYGLEIDPKKSMSEYKDKFRPKLAQFSEYGLEDFFDMAGNSPGIDEMASFEKFLEFMHSGEYDYVIFDTAPTGHTLKFLSLPEVMDSWIGKITKFRMQISNLAGMFKKLLPFGDKEDIADNSLEELDKLKARIMEARKIMSDPEKTSFWLVSIPEQMSILESARALESLKGYKISVKGIVVNQLIPEHAGCDFCLARREMQQQNLKDVKSRFKGYDIKLNELKPRELRGTKELEAVGKAVWKDGGV